MWERRTQRSERVHNLIAGGCILFAAASSLGIMRKSMEDHTVRAQYESLAQTAGAKRKTKEPEKTETQGIPYESPIDFGMLREINPDTAGWIRIPGTEIDYPIVQGSDNNIYLHKSFYGEAAEEGCIFLDFESQRDLRGYHNILYGHNMKNGTMFRDVVRYKEEDYFNEHRYFEIYTPRETIYLKAVSCYYIQDDPEVRRTRFRDNEEFDIFVRKMLGPCPYVHMPGEPVKNLYTLVTCSYESEDTRTVLFAVEADREETN